MRRYRVFKLKFESSDVARSVYVGMCVGLMFECQRVRAEVRSAERVKAKGPKCVT